MDKHIKPQRSSTSIFNKISISKRRRRNVTLPLPCRIFPDFVAPQSTLQSELRRDIFARAENRGIIQNNFKTKGEGRLEILRKKSQMEIDSSPLDVMATLKAAQAKLCVLSSRKPDFFVAKRQK
jgi:hypothetical protein